MGLFELEGGGRESPPMVRGHAGGAAKARDEAPFMVYSCTYCILIVTLSCVYSSLIE